MYYDTFPRRFHQDAEFMSHTPPPVTPPPPFPAIDWPPFPPLTFLQNFAPDLPRSPPSSFGYFCDTSELWPKFLEMYAEDVSAAPQWSAAPFRDDFAESPRVINESEQPPPPPLPLPNYNHYYLSDAAVGAPSFPDYQEPVMEPGSGERVVWEFQQVTLSRVPGYGFGIAVSGGVDNPHFANGDPSIAVSDVLKSGPAEGKLMVNDRITSANGISLEKVDYGKAVQVLRDSGNTVTLSVRRRLLLPSQEPHILRVQLNKSRKKDDFGLILGNRIYIKELGGCKLETNGGPMLQEGDVLLKINNQCADNLSLKEARKLIESSKEKLHLTVRREATSTPYTNSSGISNPLPPVCNSNNGQPKEPPFMEGLNSSAYGHGGAAQNLYVQPPTRQQQQQQHPLSSSVDSEKSNLIPRAIPLSGRSRNPLLDASLSQLDATSIVPNYDGNSHEHIEDLSMSVNDSHSLSQSEQNHHSLTMTSQHMRSRSGIQDQEPPRPPPPRPEDYYGVNRQNHQEDKMRKQKYISEEPRFLAFQKEGSVGIRLIGGNKVGIFVTAVQPGSAASTQGLQPADKILKANDLDMKGVTREEAVIFLSNVQDQVHLIVQNRREEYDQILANQLGDSLHIKAHFDYDQPNKGEMSFRKGDVFHVTDTLHNGVVGSWQAFRIGRNNQEVQKGVIPNKARAEELATAQFNATKKELTQSESRISFFRRKRNGHRRSKSLSKVDHWDDVVFGDSISKFPAYERVISKHPGFVRPVVLFGPVSDMAREKLVKDFPDKFSSPQLENPLEGVSKKASSIIRLSAIRDIMDSGKHALLDITPNAVDRLNYAQFYPIVILLRAESKQVIKELRSGLAKSAHKSSRKLFEQSQKLEKIWSHVFCGSVTLSGPDSWYRKLRELIEKHQSSPVWISEAKPDETLSDDFLFPMMTSMRLSYASSPESDLEASSNLLNLTDHSGGGGVGVGLSPRMVKCSSDPSIATQDDTAVLNGLPAYNPPPPPYTPALFTQVNRELSEKLRADIKYGTNGYIGNMGESKGDVNGSMPPDLPPRVDRANKPSRSVSTRSAQDRLFGADNRKDSGGDPPNYINATLHHRVDGNGGCLDANGASPNAKIQRSYDSIYDDYQRNAPSSKEGDDGDSKTYSDATLRSRQVHDPYRFTRSTQQPIKYDANNGKIPSKSAVPDYPQYRPPGMTEYATNKPLPPPKNASSSSGGQQQQQQYKPVPAPKPKNYVVPKTGGGSGGGQQGQGNAVLSSPLFAAPPQYLTAKEAMYQHAKSYSMGADASNYITNGLTSKYSTDNSDSNGFDSGHGSSLDRSTYDRRTGLTNGTGNTNNPTSGLSQYYYNVPPAAKQSSSSYNNGNYASNGSGNYPGNGNNSNNGYYNNNSGNGNYGRDYNYSSTGGLDLQHREQRGSAFELYKKPGEHRRNASQVAAPNNRMHYQYNDHAVIR